MKLYWLLSQEFSLLLSAAEQCCVLAASSTAPRWEGEFILYDVIYIHMCVYIYMLLDGRRGRRFSDLQARMITCT